MRSLFFSQDFVPLMMLRPSTAMTSPTRRFETVLHLDAVVVPLNRLGFACAP